MNRIIYLSLCIFAISGRLWGDDWREWRGPNRNGQATGVQSPDEWPKMLTPEWRVGTGLGHSSPVISGERLFQQSRFGDSDVVQCLDLRTGNTLWRSDVPGSVEKNLVAEFHNDGPNSTPAATEEQLVTVGSSGVISCWDQRTGELDWRQDFSKRFSKTSPLYGIGASPLIRDGICFVYAGSDDEGALLAIRMTDGVELWSWSGEGPGYSSPITIQAENSLAIAVLSRRHVLAVRCKDGMLIWKHPIETQWDQNTVTPMLCDEKLIVAGYNHPTIAIATPGPIVEQRPKVVWSNNEHPLYMSSPVSFEQRMFGFTHRQKGAFICLDLEAGTTAWLSHGRLGNNASLTMIGSNILGITDDGTLRVIDATASEFRCIAEYSLPDPPIWAHPAFAGDLMIIKGRESITAFRLSSTRGQ